MPIPTMEAMITPTITINVEIRRNRVLLKWSSNSFRKMVHIPCNLGLLKILHINLFQCIIFFVIQPQFFLSQFSDRADGHKFSFDHDPDPIAYLLDLIEEMGGQEHGHLSISAQGVNEIEHPIRSVRA